MRFLYEPAPLSSGSALFEAADAIAASGLDGIYLREQETFPAPLVAAAAVGARQPDLLVAAEIALGDRHPVEVAEELVVVDLGIGGRLVPVVRPAVGAEARFVEALDLLRTALVPRPFRWSGDHWTVPAGLPQNEFADRADVRLTPSSFQVRLACWLTGCDPRLAVERGLGFVASEAAHELAEIARVAPSAPHLVGAPRAVVTSTAPGLQAVEELQAGQREVGQDWAIVRAPVGDAAAYAQFVRPRVQISQLPAGLESLWEHGDLT